MVGAHEQGRRGNLAAAHAWPGVRPGRADEVDAVGQAAAGASRRLAIDPRQGERQRLGLSHGPGQADQGPRGRTAGQVGGISSGVGDIAVLVSNSPDGTPNSGDADFDLCPTSHELNLATGTCCIVPGSCGVGEYLNGTCSLSSRPTCVSCSALPSTATYESGCNWTCTAGFTLNGTGGWKPCMNVSDCRRGQFLSGICGTYVESGELGL